MTLIKFFAFMIIFLLFLKSYNTNKISGSEYLIITAILSNSHVRYATS